MAYLLSLSYRENFLHAGPPRYHRVERGANCEAEGYARITSLAECISATKELGHGIRNTPATLDIPNWEYAPRGCYYRPWNRYQPEATDGDLWYNKNGSNRAPCSLLSNCICKTGRILHNHFIRMYTIKFLSLYFQHENHMCRIQMKEIISTNFTKKVQGFALNFKFLTIKKKQIALIFEILHNTFGFLT